MPDAVTLTPYERRCWKRMCRELESGDPRPRGRVARRLVVAGVLAALVSAVLGGPVAVAAVAIYLGVGLALWGLFTVVWRIGPAPEPRRDLI